MCWSEGASVAMVATGAVATVVTIRRGETPAIPVTFAYFTFMEGLQAWGYSVVDQCGSPSNQVVALLSYLHIAFQPFFANAFAMAILGRVVGMPMKVVAYLACGISAVAMLLQLYPFEWAGQCTLGWVMCGTGLCTLRGDWHIGWTIPYNDLVPPFLGIPGVTMVFPTYFIASFIVPLFYGAWRMVFFHAVFGPILASMLTTNPNEMPAIWCLFSVGIIVIGLTPWIRVRMGAGGMPRPALSP